MIASTKNDHPASAPAAARVGGLDSVRALAALSVMLAHILVPNLEGLLNFTPLAGTAIPALSKYFITGVPVIAFFVVSGFCIHYPYLTRSLPVIPFLAARWARVLLPTLVAIAFALLAKIESYNFSDGYILWSIVCELFYYTLYPFFFWLSRFVVFRIQYLLSLGASISVAIYLGSDDYGNMNIFGPELNWLIHLPSWLLGCALAEWMVQKRNHGRQTHSKTSFIIARRAGMSLAGSLLLWFSFNTPAGLYLTSHLFALLSCFLINAEICASPTTTSRLEKLGAWSFSLYLMHMPIYVMIGKFMPGIIATSPLYPLLCAPLVLWLCCLFYRKIEMPTHTYARRLFQTMPTRGIVILNKRSAL